jgi:hypothetical protein
MVSKEYNQFLKIEWPDLYDDNWDVFRKNARTFHADFSKLQNPEHVAQ